MRSSLRRVGKHISSVGMSPACGPFVIAVTGYAVLSFHFGSACPYLVPALLCVPSVDRNGNVAQGAMEMLKELPVVYVNPKDLPHLVSNTGTYTPSPSLSLPKLKLTLYSRDRLAQGMFPNLVILLDSTWSKITFTRHVPCSLLCFSSLPHICSFS